MGAGPGQLPVGAAPAGARRSTCTAGPLRAVRRRRHDQHRGAHALRRPRTAPPAPAPPTTPPTAPPTAPVRCRRTRRPCPARRAVLQYVFVQTDTEAPGAWPRVERTTTRAGGAWGVPEARRTGGPATAPGRCVVPPACCVSCGRLRGRAPPRVLVRGEHRGMASKLCIFALPPFIRFYPPEFALATTTQRRLALNRPSPSRLPLALSGMAALIDNIAHLNARIQALDTLASPPSPVLKQASFSRASLKRTGRAAATSVQPA